MFDDVKFSHFHSFIFNVNRTSENSGFSLVCSLSNYSVLELQNDFIVISLFCLRHIFNALFLLEQFFVQTINQNQGILHKVCRIYCHNQEDHNDLFQEIVLQLWKAFPSFRSESKITTWMYRIALNTAISGLRKKKITLTELEKISFQIEDKKEITIEEDLQQLYKAIEYLSDIEKSIVLLYLEDKPYEEIAEITGTSLNTCLGRMRYAIQNLRKIIEKNQISLTA